jgi:hypothetical protein
MKALFSKNRDELNPFLLSKQNSTFADSAIYRAKTKKYYY